MIETIYTYPLFRPPAEANNIILQVTHGCSYNNCSFCAMYKTKKFEVKLLDKIYQEIDMLSFNYPDTTKIFLADGDALTIDTQYLLDILNYLNKSFKKLRRVSLYASTQNILNKSLEELKLLYQNNLKLIYFGIESGNDTILKKITKGVTQKDMIDSLNKVSISGIKISATMILGIGGEKYSKEHTKDTAYLVNQTKINYLSTLQLGIDESIEQNFFKHFDDFEELDDTSILIEQKEFLEQLNPTNKVIFRSNHASNALHLSGTLPKDKNRLLNKLEQSLAIGEESFIPKYFRGF